MLEDPARFVLAFAVLICSLVFHECAHVWVAWKLGDPTGKQLGRLTLNPLPHIDLFWSILLPLMCLLSGSMLIGGPKPAPVNPLNFRNPRKGHTIVAAAGPLSNLALAAGALLLLWLGARVWPGGVPPTSYNSYVLLSFVITNVVLAALNLIPVPPLDGSRILHYILGPRADRAFAIMEVFSILFILLAFRFLGPTFINPALQGIFMLLANLFEPGYLGDLLQTYFNV